MQKPPYPSHLPNPLLPLAPARVKQKWFVLLYNYHTKIIKEPIVYRSVHPSVETIHSISTEVPCCKYGKDDSPIPPKCGTSGVNGNYSSPLAKMKSYRDAVLLYASIMLMLHGLIPLLSTFWIIVLMSKES